MYKDVCMCIICARVHIEKTNGPIFALFIDLLRQVHSEIMLK